MTSDTALPVELDENGLEAAMVWFARNFNGAPDGRALTTGIVTTYLRTLSATRTAVKPLEWVGDQAVTPFGKYRVIRTDDGYALTFEFEEIVHIGFNAVGPFQSPRVEAINRAQPDYERRILSALSTTEGE